MKTTVKIKGMHCESCKLLLEDICYDIPGVIRCEANVEQGTLKIEHERPLDQSVLKQEIETVEEYNVEEFKGDERI